MKTAVINIATGRHQRGQARLVKSLADVGFKGDVLAFNNEAAVGAPKHKDCMFGFKPYAVEYARKLGYELVLWCDAANWAIKPIEPLFEHIQKEGYLLFRNGWRSSEWTSDECLRIMGISREDAFNYPHILACTMGFDLTNEKTNEFLSKWMHYANAGAFQGALTNEKGQVSQDKRVLGHRNDQSVASYLAWDMDMKNWLIPHETFLLYYQNGISVPENVVILTQGI